MRRLIHWFKQLPSSLATDIKQQIDNAEQRFADSGRPKRLTRRPYHH